MDYKIIDTEKVQISEIISQDILIKNEEETLDLMANAPSEYIVMYEHQFEPEFFDLSTRKLGAILQKFTNYRVKLAIIGDFTSKPSKTLKDFIYESNKQKEYLFMSSLDEVINTWNS